MKYKISVEQDSVVTLVLSTTATTSAQRPNSMNMDLFHANTTSMVYANTLDGAYQAAYGITVYSNEMPLQRTVTYKLMPGTYYLRAAQLGAYNALAWITLQSVTPAEPDAFGEPNDAMAQAKSIKVNTTYAGNIRYASMRDTSGEDQVDYYKLVLSSNVSSLKLTASRADTDRQNNVDVFLASASGYSIGGQVALITEPGGSITYKNVPKGTYYVVVDGWPANAYPTEYTFRVDMPTVKAKSVKLNKTAITLKKGRKITLKATISPTNTTDKTLKWTSSNPKVAKVSASGKVTALKKGKAKITVKTSNGKKYTCVVTVA
ncbi:MAG: Ig domain-containing protein [Ruminococcaceae bacterium]|nr:Ig domain-containing protein [Oscillospiraceae bacterium]